MNYPDSSAKKNFHTSFVAEDAARNGFSNDRFLLACFTEKSGVRLG
jgi:hypothetical protein